MKSRSNASTVYPHATSLVVLIAKHILYLCGPRVRLVFTVYPLAATSICDDLAYSQFLVELERHSLCQLRPCVVYTYAGKEYLCAVLTHTGYEQIFIYLGRMTVLIYEMCMRLVPDHCVR